MAAETIGPEAVQLPMEAPHYSAFQELMQRMFEVSEGALHAERKDGLETQVLVARTFAELTDRIAQRPLSALRETDAYLRGRYTGGLGDWVGRNLVNSLIAAGATALDSVDAAKDAMEVVPGWTAVANGIEYVTDSLITVAGDEIVRRTTGKEHAYYSTPLSETIGTILNLVPFGKSFVNGTNVEAAFRVAYSIPVYGAFIEQLYIRGNRMVDAMNHDQRARWLQGLVMAMSRGYLGKRFSTPMGTQPGLLLRAIPHAPAAV